MWEFSCGSVVPGCDAVFHGETEEAVLAQIPAHAAAAHGMTELPAEVVESVRAVLHEVPVEPAPRRPPATRS